MAFELKFLVIANFLENRNKPLNVVIVHRFLKIEFRVMLVFKLSIRNSTRISIFLRSSQFVFRDTTT